MLHNSFFFFSSQRELHTVRNIDFFRRGTRLYMSLFPSVRLSCTISQEPYIIKLKFLVHLCKMMIPPGVFFLIQIFISRDVRAVKGQKIVQNEKLQLHPSCTISQEQYSISSWFLVHLCKMMISPGAFFILLRFWFFGLVRRVKGQK